MNRSLMMLALFLGFSSSAMAAGESYPEVKEAVSKLAPGAEVTAVADSPIDGVLEVTVGTQVVYMSEDGRYMLQGTLYDIDSRTDLTAQRQAVLREQKISAIDASDMITFAADDEQQEVFVFTDIDCGYCRKLHNEIDQYNAAGITVHYLAFPRGGVPSGSYDKAVSVWCADDPQDAMTSAKSGQQLPDAQCENPVEDQYDLGRQVGVTGTPAIIAVDGTMMPGYVPAKELLKRLQKNSNTESANQG